MHREQWTLTMCIQIHLCFSIAIALHLSKSFNLIQTNHLKQSIDNEMTFTT